MYFDHEKIKLEAHSVSPTPRILDQHRRASHCQLYRHAIHFHHLEGSLKGHCAVTVNRNWQLTFTFKNGDAVLVDYQDYH